MTHDNTLHVQLSNSQPNKLKSGIKNGTEVSVNLSSNMISNSNDEHNDDFSYKLLLTNTQVLRLYKIFANASSANIKLWKVQLHKLGQSGEFLGILLGPLLKAGLPLMKNILKLLAKCVLIPLGLTAVASTTNAAIHKKMLGWVWQH